MRRAQCGVRCSEPGSQGTRGNPGGVTSGTVPERHRELVPHRRLDWQRPFRDGRAMPFTRRGAAPRCGSARDRGQGVSAREGTRTPAPQGRRHSRPGTGAREEMDKAVATKCERRQEGAQGTGGRATVDGIAARGGRCPRRILVSLHRVRRKELAPWSSHGPRHYQQQNTRDARRPERQALKAPR
jgi:hypothetical protein